MTRYVALSHILTDDIQFADGTELRGLLGGGAYAVAGMRLWSDSVGIVSGVGDD